MRHGAGRGAWLGGLIAIGCGGAATPSTRPLHNPSLPQVHSLADLREHDGERVEIHGRYEVTPIDMGAAAQPVFVVLSDGTELMRAKLPIAGELHLHDQPVVVIGTAALVAPADPARPAGRASGPKLAVERLAADPSARPGTIGELPLLPQVSSAAELRGNRGRWVSVYGALRRTRALDSRSAIVELELSDGTRVRAHRAPLVNWRPIAPGTFVTTVVKIAPDTPTTAFGATIPCRGNVARCGVI
jgi:hypothetical protein